MCGDFPFFGRFVAFIVRITGLLEPAALPPVRREREDRMQQQQAPICPDQPTITDEPSAAGNLQDRINLAAYLNFWEAEERSAPHPFPGLEVTVWHGISGRTVRSEQDIRPSQLCAVLITQDELDDLCRGAPQTIRPSQLRPVLITQDEFEDLCRAGATPVPFPSLSSDGTFSTV